MYRHVVPAVTHPLLQITVHTDSTTWRLGGSTTYENNERTDCIIGSEPQNILMATTGTSLRSEILADIRLQHGNSNYIPSD